VLVTLSTETGCNYERTQVGVHGLKHVAWKGRCAGMRLEEGNQVTSGTQEMDQTVQ
jgi:hypothetical protein